MTRLIFTGILILAIVDCSYSQKVAREVSMPVQTIGAYDLQLPGDMRAGDMISGLLKQLPAGNKEKEIAKNATALSENTIYIGNHVLPATTSTFHFQITPEDIQNFQVKVQDPTGKSLFQKQLDFPVYGLPSSYSTFNIPTHAVTGNPFTVMGPFDGNSENTNCLINNKPAQIITESPRQAIIQFPQDVKGPVTISITDNGLTVTETIGGVDYTVGAGKLNLKRGESTYIDVHITGLDNLKDNALLTLDNLSTGVVVLGGGNHQAITILPAEISGQGEFGRRFTVQSITTGTFSINVNLDLPEPRTALSIPSYSSWVACEPCGGVLMPASFCGSMTNYIDQYPASYLSIPADTTCNCFVFDPKIKDGNISMQVQQDAKDIAMVVYTKNDNVVHQNLPVTALNTGTNIIKATAYHGSNQKTEIQKTITVIPTFNTSISNNIINILRRRISQVKDSIDNLQRNIDNNTRRIYENYPTKKRLDSIAMSRQGYYNQLADLDRMLESIPKVYGDTLNKLIDSLARFRKKSPTDPDLDALKGRVESLEAALKACNENTQALTQEQQDLNKESGEIESKQSAELQKILDCFAAAGYDYVGHTSRNSAGDFSYGYDAVKNGQALNGVPAQCLKTVSEAKKNIDGMIQRQRDIKQRLKELPDRITQSKLDCEKISKELQDAQAALKKGKNALIEYGFINSDMADICRQISGMLEQFTRFCRLNPSVCNAEAMVQSLMSNCPQPNFWDGYNDMVNYKKRVEDNMKNQANEAKRQADQNHELEKNIYEESYRAQQQQAAHASTLSRLINQEEQATEEELEKKLLKEDSARAMRRRDCEEFLKSQAKTKEEKGWIETILNIKKGVQSLGDNVKKASEYGDKLTKDRYKEITDSLRSIIDKMIAPLKEYDKIKKNYEKWSKIKEDIETVFSGDDSPKANAEKLKVILKRIKEQLDDLVGDYPILELFVNYFGFLVDSYEWAVDQSFQNAEKFYKYHLESRMRQFVNCNWLMNEYLKRKNIDDVIRRAKERINWSGEIEPLLGAAGNRDVAEEEFKKLILKSLADCCVSYLVQ